MITEKEKQYRDKLFRLILDNPELPVVPMIDSEACADDDYARYCGSFGESYIAEYILGEEMVHFRESNPDLCELEDVLMDGFFSYDVLERMFKEDLRSAYNELNWIKAIIVNIDLPE